MRCETVQMNLKALLDGELRGLMRGRVQWHVQRCAECAAHWQEVRRTEALLRANDLFSPEPTSVAMALGNPETKGVRNLKVNLAGGLAVTVALTIGLLVVAPRSNKALTPVFRVKQALQNVNTWHLTGWALVDGKRVPWEIWGRRAPFFYREQVGEDALIDNGQERISVIGPKRFMSKSEGVFLLTPSAPEANSIQRSYEHNIMRWNANRKPVQETATQIVFKDDKDGPEGPESGLDRLYTIDKRDWLPTQYEMRRGNIKERRTIGLLQIEYDAPLPNVATTLPECPQGYRVYDTRQASPHLPTENTAGKDGLTVQMEPLLMDRQGNVLVRVKGWYGETLLDDQGPVRLWTPEPIAMQLAHRVENPLKRPFVDNRDRPFAQVLWQHLHYARPFGTHRMLLFTPLEPLEPKAPLPMTLTVTLKASLAIPSNLSDIWNANDRQSEQILEQDLTFTLPLPKPVESVEKSMAAYLDPDWRKRVFSHGGFENLEASIYVGRAQHYGHIYDHRKSDTPEHRRSAFWMERAIAKTPSDMVQGYRSRLSTLYWEMGETKRARQLLRDIIADRRFDRPLMVSPNAPKEMREWQLIEHRKIVEQRRHQAKTMLRQMDKTAKQP